MVNEEINKLICKILGEGAEVRSVVEGGMMNVAYLVTDNEGKQYILYIPTKQANEMVNRTLEKENQKIVYELGLTSKNIYFDTDSGIKVNEFIFGNSLDKIDSFDYQKIAEIFKKLHNSVMLSRCDYDPFDRFENNYEKEALEFKKEQSPEYLMLRDFLFSYKQFLQAQPLTLCHNDSQRSNIIKSSDGDYYFIDFEFMGNNDPIYDISAFGNNSVSEGRKLLEKYFDNNPTDNQIKSFYLWRIFISLQWYNVAITKHFRGEGDAHNIDFLKVSEHFLKNAKDAYDGFKMEINENMNNEETKQLIITTLDKIRHFLRKDGGDCEFVSFEDGIVYVKMTGACQDCSFASADIKELIEVILQEEVPGVIEVRNA